MTFCPCTTCQFILYPICNKSRAETPPFHFNPHNFNYKLFTFLLKIWLSGHKKITFRFARLLKKKERTQNSSSRSFEKANFEGDVGLCLFFFFKPVAHFHLILGDLCFRFVMLSPPWRHICEWTFTDCLRPSSQTTRTVSLLPIKGCSLHWEAFE